MINASRSVSATSVFTDYGVVRKLLAGSIGSCISGRERVGGAYDAYLAIKLKFMYSEMTEEIVFVF